MLFPTSTSTASKTFTGTGPKSFSLCHLPSCSRKGRCFFPPRQSISVFIPGDVDALNPQHPAAQWCLDLLINQVDSNIFFLVEWTFSSVAQSCPTLCNPMNRSTPGLPVHHQLPEFTQTHVHRVGDAIQPSHPLSSPSPPALNPSQHQSLFQWVNSSHEVAKVLEFQF